MAQCSKCGSGDMNYMSGISKKSNKPYAGNKCQSCGNMDFVQAPKNLQQHPAVQQPKTNKDDAIAKAVAIKAATECICAIQSKTTEALGETTMGQMVITLAETFENYLVGKVNTPTVNIETNTPMQPNVNTDELFI